MTDQQCYNVAEVLTHNKDYIKSKLTPYYIKARTMPRNDAILYMEDMLKYQLADLCKYPLTDIDYAFGDERVKIVISRLFLKEFYYEH